MDMNPELVDAYRQGQLILFVGAGVSRALELPSWRQLIDRMARELGYDPEVFQTYGNDLTLAEFCRLEHKGQLKTFWKELDKEWHKDKAWQRDKIASSRLHGLVANSNFDLIYTTNYDRWLELAFKHYAKQNKRRPVKIVGVSDMAKVKPGDVQIVKFHGDFDNFDSIVLDESGYFERFAFESPLDIKLRADVLGRSVLFIGYGLTDPNIRYLFHRLAKLWQGRPARQRPVSYIFSYPPNPIQQRVLKEWNIEMLSSEEDDPQKALEDFLEALLQPPGAGKSAK